MPNWISPPHPIKHRTLQTQRRWTPLGVRARANETKGANKGLHHNNGDCRVANGFSGREVQHRHQPDAEVRDERQNAEDRIPRDVGALEAPVRTRRRGGGGSTGRHFLFFRFSAGQGRAGPESIDPERQRSHTNPSQLRYMLSHKSPKEQKTSNPSTL